MNLLPRLTVAAIGIALLLAMPARAALKPGDKAPEFTAPAYLAGKPFTYGLADALAKGPVVLYFFPAANTPGCNLEASLFSQAVDEFAAHGASVIGVTAGNTEQLAAFSSDKETCSGKFPVAADEDAQIARDYDALLAKRPDWSDRTSYVISASGDIVHVHSDLNPNRHVAETLAAVEALASK